MYSSEKIYLWLVPIFKYNLGTHIVESTLKKKIQYMIKMWIDWTIHITLISSCYI